ncbi:MAG TPA: DUF5719 family protein [Streptosporangiaceae bacterium]
MTRALPGRVGRFVPVALVLLALAAIGAVTLIKPATSAAGTQATTPKAVRSAATLIRQVPISTAIRACPPGADAGQNRIAAFAATAGPGNSTPASTTAAGATSAGTAVLNPLPQSSTQGVAPTTPANLASITAVNTLSLISVPATTSVTKQQGWSIVAQGAMAQGLEAEVADASGQASVRCAEPNADTWFVGPGQQDGAGQIQLDLMNVDSLAATVNLNVITDAGAVQSPEDSGINVPPHTLATESLSAQAGGASVTAIEVHTSTGRVAANLVEGSSHGLTSWLPSAAPPSTGLVIPGVPPSGTAASLFLVVPGNTAAKVSVVAITAQGHYQPFGSQSIDLPGQSASAVQLTPIGGAGAALELSSNVPVTAAVLVPGSGLGTFTAATAAIAQQAVIAGNPTTGGFAASIALSAPGVAGHVRLTEIGEGAQPAAQIVTIPPGRTLAESVKAPAGTKRGAPFTVVITPLSGSGPVYAARIETHGQNSVVSIVPAVSALTTTGLPPVRASYTAISP